MPPLPPPNELLPNPPPFPQLIPLRGLHACSPVIEKLDWHIKLSVLAFMVLQVHQQYQCSCIEALQKHGALSSTWQVSLGSAVDSDSGTVLTVTAAVSGYRSVA